MENGFSEKIVVVGDNPTCMGFRLAGVQNVYPEGEAGAQARIESLLSEPEIGIIIVNEKTMDFLDSRLKNRIAKVAKPVVIAVPDKDGPMEQGEDSLRSIVKKALGFELIK